MIDDLLEQLDITLEASEDDENLDSAIMKLIEQYEEYDAN